MSHRKLTSRARDLRQKQTDAEKLLWSRLRRNQLGYHFKRQYPIEPYIADFYCADLNLVVEVDGSQHNEVVDKKRSDFIESKGFKIVRFWNNDVLNNIDGVMRSLLNTISDPPPSLTLPPQAGRGNVAPNPKNRICVGKVATSHGVRGWVKVHCYADDPKILQTCGPLYASETGDKTITLKLKTATNTHWLAEVTGVTDRDAADRLRGTELYLDRDDLPELNDGYYHADLIGLSVINDDGAVIGVVSAIDNFGASDLIEVKPEIGQAFYIPLTDDYAIIEIENNRVVIRNYSEFQNLPVAPAQAGVHDQEKHQDMDSRLRGNDEE